MAMADSINQFREMMKEMSIAKKSSMIVVVLISLIVIGYLVHLSRQTEFTPLFTNLNSDDVGSIVTQLDKQGVAFQVDADKKLILVPANQVLDLRMKMAGLGLPRFGGIGFELFDSKGFGMSEFEQKLNFQRALQGELSRTINELDEVEESRVHLVLPAKSLFGNDEQEVSASVIIKLGNGGISKNQVNSIVHLVASAVEDLDAAKVTVVDTQGHLLSNGGDKDSIASGQVFEQKRSVERSLEQQISGLLEPIVGLGKVVARAAVDVDFSRLEEMVQKVDPKETVVLSETTSKKSEQGSSGGGGGGVAGVAANLPGAGGAVGGGGGGSTSDENTSSTNYDVTRITRKQIIPSGAIKKISMAVMLDGNYAEADGKKTFTPRTAEEMAKFETMIKSAIGFNAERGDSIKLESMAFANLEDGLKNTDSFWAQRDKYSFMITIAINILIVLIALGVIMFVIRPIFKAWKERQDAVEGASGLSILGGSFDPEKLRGEIAKLVSANPQQTANVIRQWLQK